MKTILLTLTLAITLNCFGQSTEKLAPTPPMGWNSWNWFGKNEINEVNMKQCMDAMVSEGLLDAGYEYFVIDGGWRDTKLGPNGELLANPVKFPNGIKPLADYAHSLGLKFGLHTVPGTHDCGGDQVGGLGHEEVQIQQFVDWGLDFIKLDKCKNKNPDGWNEDLLKETYVKWRKLLDKSGRDIVLSISAYTWRDWYPEVGQMARTTGDIMTISNNKDGTLFDPPADYKKKFNSVMEIAEKNNKSAEFAGNGYWNDPDMLTTGMHGLTLDEQKAQFALWCIMSSPLILGNDPRNMTSEEKDIITNDLAISINQDNTEQGKRIKVDGKTEVWAKKLKGGDLAILLLNRDSEKSNIFEISIKELGLNGKFTVLDVYAKKELGKVAKSVSQEVRPHSCAFLLIKHKK
jgi:alpha-galactosidase